MIEVKKNKKPKLVFIYGPIATGKLTVAKELHKITKYLLLHNHIIIDFTKGIFPEHEDKYRHGLQEDLFFSAIKQLILSKRDVIVTFAYAKTYVSGTGMSDPVFVKKIETIVKKNGGEFYPVQLCANEKEILRRATSTSRREFKKLTDISVLKKLLSRDDIYHPAKFTNNLCIDNSKVSAKKVAEIIKKHFKI